MKFNNWTRFFENDPNSDLYNKQAESIVNATIDTASDDECITTIKKEPNLIALSVAPITKSIQVFHHVTEIGGCIANPDKSIIALSGFDTKASSVHLSPDIFTSVSNVAVPKWTSVSSAKTPAEALSKTPLPDLRPP